MDSGGEIEDQALEFQKIEDVFGDRDGEVFDTLLSFGSINQLQAKLKTLKEQGKGIHGVYRSYFSFFMSRENPKFS